MSDLTIVELQFNYRAFIAYLAELLRLEKKGEKKVDEKPIEREIQRTENMLRDLKELVKRRINEGL